MLTITLLVATAQSEDSSKAPDEADTNRLLGEPVDFDSSAFGLEPLPAPSPTLSEQGVGGLGTPSQPAPAGLEPIDVCDHCEWVTSTHAGPSHRIDSTVSSVLAHQVERCYNTEIQQRRGVKGKLTVTLEMSTGGYAWVDTITGVSSPTLHRCVSAKEFGHQLPDEAVPGSATFVFALTKPVDWPAPPAERPIVPN